MGETDQGRRPPPDDGGRAPRLRLGALVERTHDVISVVDSHARVVWNSARARALTGTVPGDLPRFELLHPEDRDEAMRGFMEALDAPGRPVPSRYRLRDGDGWRWIEGTTTNLLDDPDVAGIVLSAVDVTERVEAEERLRRRLQVEETLAAISRDLMDHADDVDGCIERALARLGPLARADRAYLFLVDHDHESMSNTHEWCADGIAPQRADLQDIDLDALPWWTARMREGATLAVNVDELPPEAEAERLVLEAGAIQALVCVPLRERDHYLGFVGFDAVAERRQWSDRTLGLLEQCAALLSTVLARAAAARERDRTEARIRALVQNSSDMIVVVAGDGTLTDVSAASERILGRASHDLLGASILDFVHPDDLEEALRRLQNVLSGQRSGEPVALRLRHADDRWVPVEVLGNELGVGEGVVVNVRDMSESVRIAASLREAKLRFQQVFEHAPIGIALAASDGTLVEVNPALCAMVGRESSELVGQTWAAITHPDDVTANRELNERLFAGEIPSYSVEKRYRHSAGHWVWARVNASLVRDDDGTPRYAVGQIEDITERRELLDRLAHDATHDALTGLTVRSVLVEALAVALATSHRVGRQAAALFVDLDRFKQVNDRLGHAAGDDLLVQVADRIRLELRAGDTGGRFGGDEFVVVCGMLEHPGDAVALAERLRHALTQPFVVQGAEVSVGASIGVALSGPADDDPEMILHHADTAAYQAKDQGRNRIEVFDGTLRDAVEARRTTEAALHDAIGAGELRLLYQPQVRGDGVVIGFEALVRWERPGHGLLEPASFLATAEETGLVVPLGREVLRLAGLQLAEWSRLRPHDIPRLSVNLSARELSHVGLVGEVERTLATAAVTPEHLCLEITETDLLQDTEATMRTLGALRKMGVELAIDDFGTGYSSLSYLRRFPATQVKIDRSFVAELEDDDAGATIVGSIIHLAHALDLSVVAEGVETAGQAGVLLTLGCDVLQGFWFSAAVPASAATAMLSEPPRRLSPLPRRRSA